MRGATYSPWSEDGEFEISTHAPLAGRDDYLDGQSPRLLHFNPRAPCGARRMTLAKQGKVSRFQPTRPLRGATVSARRYRANVKDFNPRAPCGARPANSILNFRLLGSISTHAPLAGRDIEIRFTPDFWSDFNPRAPCGARLVKASIVFAWPLFQPTRPLRGATTAPLSFPAGMAFQPTRPLRGATRTLTALQPDGTFQPTRPLRGATAKVYKSLCTFLR